MVKIVFQSPDVIFPLTIIPSTVTTPTENINVPAKTQEMILSVS